MGRRQSVARTSIGTAVGCMLPVPLVLTALAAVALRSANAWGWLVGILGLAVCALVTAAPNFLIGTGPACSADQSSLAANEKHRLLMRKRGLIALLALYNASTAVPALILGVFLSRRPVDPRWPGTLTAALAWPTMCIVAVTLCGCFGWQRCCEDSVDTPVRARPSRTAVYLGPVELGPPAADLRDADNAPLSPAASDRGT